MTTTHRTQIDAFDKLSEIREAQKWLESLGLAVKNTRYTHALTLLENGIIDGEVVGDDMIEFQWALDELDEFVEVHKLLSESVDTRLIDSLSKSLKGALSNANEQVGASASGRNYLFELLVAAKFKKMGFDVTFEGLADVVVQLKAGNLFVECKRAAGENVSNLLKDAFRQVRTRCEKTSDRPQFGIVALSMTRGRIRESRKNGPMLETIQSRLEADRERASSLSFKAFRSYCPPGIGVITVTSTPFWNSEDESLVAHRRMNMHPLIDDNHPFLQEMRARWK